MDPVFDSGGAWRLKHQRNSVDPTSTWRPAGAEQREGLHVTGLDSQVVYARG
jgi:hypothetical protein